MKITLKLFVSLQQYLPAEAKGNIAEIEVSEDESPQAVLERYNVPLKQTHLWLLNGTYIEPERRTESLMKDGDTLAVWPPVAGG
jgi:molybdopterin synthase sulfur carrier subunit